MLSQPTKMRPLRQTQMNFKPVERDCEWKERAKVRKEVITSAQTYVWMLNAK